MLYYQAWKGTQTRKEFWMHNNKQYTVMYSEAKTKIASGLQRLMWSQLDKSPITILDSGTNEMLWPSLAQNAVLHSCSWCSLPRPRPDLSSSPQIMLVSGALVTSTPADVLAFSSSRHSYSVCANLARQVRSGFSPWTSARRIWWITVVNKIGFCRPVIEISCEVSTLQNRW